MLLSLLLACGEPSGDSDSGSKPAVDNDKDGDGYVAADAGGDDCWDDPDSIPAEYSAVQGEAQPTAADVHPDATDFPYDGVDADCAGDSDFDLDNDGVDSADNPQQDGSVGTDCNDEDAATFPGATEVVGDGADEDCDGRELCYEDADGDHHGALGGATVVSDDLDCDDAGEAVADLAMDDCNDGDASIFPGATEGTADGIDQDCDGMEACYVDADADGYGDNTGATVLSTSMTCSLEGQVGNADDCDDTDIMVSPYAHEVCDGKANDCTTAADWVLADEDGLIAFQADGSTIRSDVTSQFTPGTSTTPATVTVTTPGRYTLCTGSWYAGFSSDGVDFSAEVLEGHATTLSFNKKAGSSLVILNANATISNLDIESGKGTTVEDATYGGLLYATDDVGGHTIVLDHVSGTEPASTTYGGAIAALGLMSVELRGGMLEGSADLGGIVYLEDGTFSCVADGVEDAGLFNADANVAGGAVYLATDAGTFTSDGCDFDGNTPDDIAGANGSWAPYLLSPLLDASFTCTGSAGCTF